MRLTNASWKDKDSLKKQLRNDPPNSNPEAERAILSDYRTTN